MASHTATVVSAMSLLLLLGLAALLYSRCHLNCKLWYKNNYGDYELNGEEARTVKYTDVHNNKVMIIPLRENNMEFYSCQNDIWAFQLLYIRSEE